MLLPASVLAESALGCTADMLDVYILQVSEQPYRCASMSVCGMTSENTRRALRAAPSVSAAAEVADESHPCACEYSSCDA